MDISLRTVERIMINYDKKNRAMKLMLMIDSIPTWVIIHLEEDARVTIENGIRELI